MNSSIIKFWVRQHKIVLLDTWQRLKSQPAALLLNVLVLAMAFILPVVGYTLLENLRPLIRKLNTDPEISVFMKTTANRTDSQAVESQIRGLAEVDKVIFVSREQALAQLKAQSDLADVLAALPSNPLPDAFIIQPKRIPNLNQNTQELEALVQVLRELPQVEQVQLDSAWLKRMNTLLRLLRLGLFGAASILVAAAIAVVFNTIRLQVLLVQEEIGVLRLLGATDQFIRRPFCYLGAIQGLLAGGIAYGFTWSILNPLNQALGEFADLYVAEFQFTVLPIAPTIGLLGCCALLGWLGAWLSISKYLRQR